ncbi:DUF3006 domain-containing protein [Desulforamulus ferrireducens]|uniref:DUF3006 domain-containing protein n=1 Tax=Desulforamulus ferrireducens TaxID=1833852 RepID=A0A1S6IYZ4_9FIRM|nr:DUF3006 domain-containing protein [Desulforamulus ferrireducens]AQS59989.1 hypothetical protein B0537_13440 [Desulforamulus ferrireducens]
MRAVIDRFEENWAVLEAPHGIMWNVPRQFLPPEVKEGDEVAFSFTRVETRSIDNSKLVEELFE